MRDGRLSDGGTCWTWGSVAALALVLLVLHAAYVGAAHAHRLTPARVSEAERSFRVRDTVGSEQAQDDGSRCLLCRLQRTLSSSLGNSARLSAHPARCSQPRTEPSLVPRHGSSTEAPTGRAPPSA